MIQKLPQANDSIAAAYQLGRLDLITVLLAVVTLLFALAAIPGFFYFKYRAEQAARDEVRARTNEIAEQVEREAISKIEERLPTLFEEYRELIQNAVTPTEANAIAGAQDDDGNEPIPENS